MVLDVPTGRVTADNAADAITEARLLLGVAPEDSRPDLTLSACHADNTALAWSASGPVERRRSKRPSKALTDASFLNPQAAVEVVELLNETLDVADMLVAVHPIPQTLMRRLVELKAQASAGGWYSGPRASTVPAKLLAKIAAAHAQLHALQGQPLLLAVAGGIPGRGSAVAVYGWPLRQPRGFAGAHDT